MISALTDRMGQIIATPRGFYLFVGGYIAVIFLIRALLFPGAPYDAAEQLLYSQTFASVYDLHNPPLFTWLVIAAQKVFGVTIFSFAAVKFTLLLLTYVFVYRSAQEILEDDRLAALAALSLLAFYEFAWVAVVKYSHSVLLTTMCAATFYALLRVGSRADLRAYIALGVVAGLGLISKYNFALFLSALILAAMCDRDLRAALLHRRILVSIAISAAVMAPHYHWFIENWGALTREAGGVFRTSSDGGFFGDFVMRLKVIAKAYLDFFVPLVVLLPLFFWRAFTPLPAGAPRSVRLRRVLGISLVLMTAVTVIGVLAFGASRIEIRYLYVFILFPIYFFARVQAAGPSEKAVNRFSAVLMFCAVLVLGTLVATYAADPLRCKKCFHHIPYAAFAKDLRRAGFTGGTILTMYRPLPIGGNLRPYFPDSRIVDLDRRYARFAPPAPAAPGQCLIIWDLDLAFSQLHIRPELLAEARKRFGVDVDLTSRFEILTRPMPMSKDRWVRFGFILMPEGSGTCR